MMGQGPAHDEARVIVQEHRDVKALLPAEQELEDVALPHLIRGGPLESARRRGCLRQLRLGRLEQALFVEDPPHRRLRDAQAFEARQDVADLPGAQIRLGLLGGDHRGSLHLRAGRAYPFLGPWRLRFQPIQAVFTVTADPLKDRRHADPERLRDTGWLGSTVDHCLDHPYAELVRVACRTLPIPGTLASLSATHVHPFRAVGARSFRGDSKCH